MAIVEKQGSMFGINGILGMLIATVLLLSILVVLTIMAIKTQQAQATNYYDPAPIVGSLDNIKMNSTDNAKFAFVDAK
jgi:flagellar basal body-associated protein FliL